MSDPNKVSNLLTSELFARTTVVEQSPMDRFQTQLKVAGLSLRKTNIEILQVNVGKLCNLSCIHCHVESGPTKTRENMNRETAESVVRFMERSHVKTVDLTGGAPELNPHFDYLVLEAKRLRCHVIDRCNLTVFYEPGKDYLPEFFAENQVEVIASLPCYEKPNVDKQRGRGTFDKSIQALLWLNRLGYGLEDTGLVLNLVYNPVGPHLPPPQAELEQDYKERLLQDFGIWFNRLYTITNMPITRYAAYLRALKKYDEYVELLITSFNPHTVAGLMCRNTLSVSWDGRLYDCDFNQMLHMELRRNGGEVLTLETVSLEELESRNILTGNHCFGCTSGAGSSCQGAIQ